MKLTGQFVRRAVCPEGKIEIVYWDDSRKGLGLRVHSKGTKTWICYFRHNRKQYKISLGHPPAVTVREARRLHAECMAKLDQGENPHDDAQPEPTMNDLALRYIDRHVKGLKRGHDIIGAIEKRILPRFGSLPVSAVRRLDVDKLHKDIGKDYPVQANRILAYLSGMFNFAKKMGILPAGAENPAAFVEKFPEKKRTVWVTPEVMTKLLEALQSEDVLARAAILLFRTTGLRHRELIHRRWEDVDWEHKILNLADTKSGRPFMAPLSDAALEILKGIPRVYGNPYIFPGRHEGQPLREFPRRALQRIRQHVGMQIRVHDLRRTFGSWLANSGVSLKVIAGLLNQSTQSVTDSVYAQLANDPLRQAASVVGEKLQQIVVGDTIRRIVATEENK
ncbi:MAG: tyrosine-type recombinase/integrase [bacterium]